MRYLLGFAAGAAIVVFWAGVRSDKQLGNGNTVNVWSGTVFEGLFHAERGLVKQAVAYGDARLRSLGHTAQDPR